jgi:hypothetical protein
MTISPHDDPKITRFRNRALAVEKEYYDVRVLLRDAQAGLRADPPNEELTARVRYLAWRLKDLEKQFPWLLSEVSSEKGSLCGAWQEVTKGDI